MKFIKKEKKGRACSRSYAGVGEGVEIVQELQEDYDETEAVDAPSLLPSLRDFQEMDNGGGRSIGSGMREAGFAGEGAPRAGSHLSSAAQRCQAVCLGQEQKNSYIGGVVQCERGVLTLLYPVGPSIVSKGRRGRFWAPRILPRASGGAGGTPSTLDRGALWPRLELGRLG